MERAVVVGLHAVILAVASRVPLVLVVTAPGGTEGLPFGPLDPDADRTLERGLRRYAREQTEFELAYVEQLYTFGDRDRSSDPRLRPLSVAYLALVRQRLDAGSAGRWSPVYDHLPWEDRREEPHPETVAALTALASWSRADRARRDRVDIAFGTGGARWDSARALERYELLWEAGLVTEAAGATSAGTGVALTADHRGILSTALGRLRGKLGYRPVIFELLPVAFTLRELQQVVEALGGARVHTPNFRRLVEAGGLVEPTGERVSGMRGRPAARFRFRPEVLRERPAPGLGLPVLR